jgi:anti-sigma factor RsiW
MDQHDPQVEALLRASRPEPHAHFRAQTERDLFPARTFRRRPLLLGAATAGALAAGALIAGLIGLEPFAADDDVQAGRDCTTVTVTRTERVPVIVDGDRIEYRLKPVQRRVERCTSR